MDIYLNGTRAAKRAGAEQFTGTVWQDPINEAPEPARIRAIRVTFEPGARTAWHSHPLGQTLYVLSGVGRVQMRGQPVREIKPGDVVWISPGEDHWHGAAPDNSMVHVAIQESLDGVHVEWGDQVSDQDYNLAPVAL